MSALPEWQLPAAEDLPVAEPSATAQHLAAYLRDMELEDVFDAVRILVETREDGGARLATWAQEKVLGGSMPFGMGFIAKRFGA